jgi:hypothetical protein
VSLSNNGSLSHPQIDRLFDVKPSLQKNDQNAPAGALEIDRTLQSDITITAQPALQQTSHRQFLQQRLRLLQIAHVEPFSELPVHRSQQFARLLHLALVVPEAGETLWSSL